MDIAKQISLTDECKFLVFWKRNLVFGFDWAPSPDSMVAAIVFSDKTRILGQHLNGKC